MWQWPGIANHVSWFQKFELWWHGSHGWKVFLILTFDFVCVVGRHRRTQCEVVEVEESNDEQTQEDEPESVDESSLATQELDLDDEEQCNEPFQSSDGDEESSSSGANDDSFLSRAKSSTSKKSTQRNRFLHLIRTMSSRHLRKQRRVAHQPIKFGQLCAAFKTSKYYKRIVFNATPEDRKTGAYWDVVRRQVEQQHNKLVSRVHGPTRRRRTKEQIAAATSADQVK